MFTSSIYKQLWGPGLVHANDIVNDRPWLDSDSPSAALSGKPSVRTRLEAVFGEYCLYKIAKEQKSGKWQPNAEMGIWLGYSSDLVNGHRIAPIKWNKDSQCWDIGAVVTASTVKLYPDVFPLRMGPDRADELGSAGFETFAECLFEPLLVGGGLSAVVDSGGADAAVAAGVTGDDVDAGDANADNADADATNAAGIDYEVELVKAVRDMNGVKDYLAKWLGYPNRNNVQRSESELEWVDHQILNEKSRLNTFTA